MKKFTFAEADRILKGSMSKAKITEAKGSAPMDQTMIERLFIENVMKHLYERAPNLMALKKSGDLEFYDDIEFIAWFYSNFVSDL